MLSSFNKENQIWISPEKPEIDSTPKPLFPHKMNGGVCIVLGTHLDAERELDQVLKIHKDAHFCAVNDATGLVPAHHLATCHGEKIEKFIDIHERTWGIVASDYDLPFIHMMDAQEAQSKRPHYRWNIRIGAGSAAFASAAMVSLGYDLVIMCGCPMNGGGGYSYPAREKDETMPRIGDISANHNMVKAWHRSLLNMKATYPELSSKIRSVSGFTKSVFGGL